MEGETLQAHNQPRMHVRRFRVAVVTGPDRGTEVASDGERVVVGKAEGAQLVLRDPLVSRLHAELVPSDQGVILRDLGSKNGTFLGSARITEAVLTGPATLTLGDTTLAVDIGADSADLALSERARFGSLVGRSEVMRRAFHLLERAAPTRASVLLRGERGTGKQEAARALHEASSVASGPFVVVDCAGTPGPLLESELFGHSKGTFSAATAPRRGALSEAAGGTILLDEVGELPAALQFQLLQAIERRTFRPLGAEEDEALAVRFISATQLDLSARINARRFRSDLYYRLAVVVVPLPSLRERNEDLLLLVDEALRSLEAEAGLRCDAEQRQALVEDVHQHRFVGNVRELRSYIERSLILGARGVFDERPPPSDPGDLGAAIDATAPFKIERERWNDRCERRYLELLLRAHTWNVSAAARAACIERESLHRLLRHHGLQRPR